ncbi:MAG: SMC-Scp complex subunit ScpB [Tissierellia bacterium]|nr:SMC-Scp complex subunit ScpB [Tissierellia bacterium]
MNDREYIAIIESILFIWAEPIHTDEISRVLDLSKKDTKRLIEQMKEEFEHYRRGLVVNDYDGYIQLTTRSDYDSYISKLVKKNRKRTLTNSSMEVLALIAYKQPITRIEVDDIRGVKSYSSIETLLSKGLIKEVGRLDKIGKPILYGTTPEFLAFFDISNLKDLPSVEQIELLDDFLLDDEDEN